MSSVNNCKWCGSNKHSQNRCPTRNFVKALLDEPLEPDAVLPYYIAIMDSEELFNKSEKELHDEVVNLKKVKMAKR